MNLRRNVRTRVVVFLVEKASNKNYHDVVITNTHNLSSKWVKYSRAYGSYQNVYFYRLETFHTGLLTANINKGLYKSTACTKILGVSMPRHNCAWRLLGAHNFDPFECGLALLQGKYPGV